MTKITHDDVIEWPNGEGFTYCSREYADTMAAKDAIFDPNHDEGTSEDLSPEDYNRFHELDNKLMSMQADGHIGESVRY